MASRVTIVALRLLSAVDGFVSLVSTAPTLHWRPSLNIWAIFAEMAHSPAAATLNVISRSWLRTVSRLMSRLTATDDGC